MIVFLFDLAILFMLILVYLQLLRMGKNLRNIVVVPELTVNVDKGSYLHGDTVTISGGLIENGDPVPDATIVLRLPDGTTPNVTTDKDGKYSATWVVPDSVSGVLTITAMGLGITATTTFTLKKLPRNIYPCGER